MKTLLTLALALWSVSAQAHGLRLFSFGGHQEEESWQAVGRLEISGEAFCTGALIAPDLVLTAAHCLYDAATKTRVPTDQMYFMAGWRNGAATAQRYVVEAEHHPAYVFSANPGPDRVRVDIALLKLQVPILDPSIVPFEIDRKPEMGQDVVVVSYAHDRSGAPKAQDTCGVLAEQDGMLLMSCPVDFGSSGSPVFSLASGNPRIVSVVSGKAMANGRDVSLGTALHGPIKDVAAMLGMSEQVGKAIVYPDKTSEVGARFVKP